MNGHDVDLFTAPEGEGAPPVGCYGLCVLGSRFPHGLSEPGRSCLLLLWDLEIEGLEGRFFLRATWGLYSRLKGVKSPIRRISPGAAREFLFASSVFSFSYVLSFVPIPATDFFWQVATGRFVLGHGVPHADPFSHTAYGKPWTAHEWLACVLFALLFDGPGPDAVLKAKGLICALSVLAVYLACRARGAPQGASFFSALLCALVCRPYFDLRPQVLTYLLLAFLVALIGRSVRRGPGWLPFLFLPFQALWANIQGGFVLGPALALVFALAFGITGRLKKGLLFLSLFAALVAASCLNPYGPRHLLYPLGYAGFKTVYTAAVVEWQPPDFRNPYFWPFEALIILLLLLAPSAVRRGESPLFDLLVLLPFLHLSLGVRKHVPIFAIVASPPLALWLGGALRSALRRVAKGAAEGGPTVAYVVASLVLLITLPFVPFRERAFERYAVLSHFPVEAASFLERRRLPSRLFNPYDWGGYLIFRLWPRYLVFIDGRTDLYGRFVLEDYREALGPRWEAVFQRYRVGTAVVRTGSEMFTRLKGADGWRLVYKDHVAAIFVKTSG